MAIPYNRCRMTTATTGTGTMTLGSAYSNAFCTFAEAGVPNAATVTYLIEEGNDFEIGRGVYTSAGTTLTRATVLISKIGGTSGTTKMNLAGAAVVSIVNAAEDYQVPRVNTIELGADTDTTLSRSSAGILAVEGVTVPLNSTTSIHTAQQIELGAASDTTLSRSAAGVLAVEGVIVNMVGKQTIWVPAAAMVATTTNGAAAGTVETATNKVMIKTLDFDTTTQEFAQFSIRMPKSWNESTITFIPVWSHPSTSTNFGVVWALQAMARSDNEALDNAFGTEQTSTDTGGTTNNIYIGPESSAITVGSTPTEGDYVVFQIKRAPANASDTMAVDARLHGVIVIYTTNAANDA